MKAACHGKPRKGGIPRAVGCKFAAADKRRPPPKRKGK